MLKSAWVLLVVIGSLGGCTQNLSPLSDTAIGDRTQANDRGPNAKACDGRTGQPLDQTLTLTFGGVSRTVDVHVPKNYDPKKPSALVLDFHCYGGDEKQEQGLTHINEKADAAGFVSVHARGTGGLLSWNAGACCGDAKTTGVDDVGFVRAMLDVLDATLCLDPKRIFATGFSNGGFLSYRLACELADRVAAVAPVASVLGITSCAPKRPVPVMHFHGTSDPLVPWGGDPSLGYPSVLDTHAGWAKRNGCGSTTKEIYRKGDTHCDTYDGCPAGVAVTLCTVDGGGHTWPGGFAALGPGNGKMTTDISATDAMWDFFVTHPMR